MAKNQAEMNPHIKRDDAVKSSRLWAVKYRVHPKDPEKPFAFERVIKQNKLKNKVVPLKYLDDIYATLHRLENLYLVICKPRQCMISEFNVNSTFFICDTQKGLTILYILQDEKTGIRFVKKRIDAPISNSPYILSMINAGQYQTGDRSGRKKQIDSLAMKRFGQCWFYLAHSSSDKISRSIDADIVIFDEYDAHDMSNETSFRSCADNSDVRAYIYTSTPTLPDYGVDIKYKSTSMAKWTIKCKSCLEDFVMDSVYFFGDGVRVLDAPRWYDNAVRIFVCPHCGEEVLAEDKQKNGRFVHEHPEKIKENRMGFQFSHLILPHVTADRAWADYQECLMDPKKGRKGYYNEKLGEACIEEEASARFTRDIMIACKDPLFGWVSAAKGTSIGVDWGKETHVTILEKIDAGIQLLDYRVFKASSKPLENAKEVVKLFVNYQPEHITTDFGAGQEQNKYVQSHCDIEAFYAAVNHESMKDMNPRWNPKTHMVAYDVVTVYSALAYWFAAQMVKLPGVADGKLELFIQHFCNSFVLDPNKRAAVESEVQHFEVVEKIKPKVIAKKGPIHLLSSTLFAFLPFLGGAAEDFNFSDVSDVQMPEGFDPMKSVKFTRDAVSEFYNNQAKQTGGRNILCHRL